ncbi:hypothetical protein UFOVP276_156 [uncultured Caudovirales phage]|uniref:Uncharacterized protein n=1 Tax=uncultured Caudovirales phage TaxID=2100421 RepID=A0A6J5LQB8_9CAUD|nr:hypothetical protein UFOVP127_50 [uncultured Caudovirales phage]CAB4135200.1 hypothetical protein UFOVP276_156 [uncultured Caudovirales phage]
MPRYPYNILQEIENICEVLSALTEVAKVFQDLKRDDVRSAVGDLVDNLLANRLELKEAEENEQKLAKEVAEKSSIITPEEARKHKYGLRGCTGNQGVQGVQGVPGSTANSGIILLSDQPENEEDDTTQSPLQGNVALTDNEDTPVELLIATA